MRHLRSSRVAIVLAATALVAASLPLLTGCWPLAPIAAVALAAGGGGGGGGAKGVLLTGTIITDANGLALNEPFDREPNDTLGSAFPLGSLPRARRIQGTTQLRETVHALVADDLGASVVRQELLADESTRFAAPRADAGAPHALARRGNELFELSLVGGASRVRVTPLVSGLKKRELDLALAVTPAGASACLDALLVLDHGHGASGDDRLVAFDADTGASIDVHDLHRGGLAHLAGAPELLTGRDRLFTCDPKLGEILELDVASNGNDRTFGALRSRGKPSALANGIAGLGYDGVLLHALDRDGTLHSFDADSLVEVAARPLLAKGERALGLVAHFDLGFDGYHFDLAPGQKTTVELATASDAFVGGRFFLAALDRSTAADGSGVAPLFFGRTSASPALLHVDLAAPIDAPKSFDVFVGSLAGAGHYDLALGTSGQAPPAATTKRGNAASTLAALVESSYVAKLADDRIVALYRDPLLNDFVPGRVVLGRADDAASELATPTAPKGFALAARSHSPSGFDVFDVTTTPEFKSVAPRTIGGVASQRATRREQARELIAALDGLNGAPGTKWREPVFLVHTLAVPNDPGYAADQTWNYGQLNLPAAWNATTGDPNTVLAVVDTGARTDNADFNANLSTHGFDFVSTVTAPGSSTGSADGDGYDSNPFDEGTFFTDAHHGSHTGGTMGARGNNALQGTGICWNCTILPVRALGAEGSGLTTDIAEGILYAAKLANASGTTPPTRAAVINLSIGTSSPSNAIHNAITSAIAQGCVVCCAAGNDGNGSAVLYPAAFTETIAVAASAFDGSIAPYSNTGPQIDVTCPGGSNDGNPAHDVWSTVVVGGVGQLQPLAGTSMACAHASGVCGLLASAYPQLDQSIANSALIDTAVDINDPVNSPFSGPGFDNASGYGLVDASAAIAATPPQMILTATKVDFGNTGTDLAVQAFNPNLGTLVVDSSLPITSMQTPGGVPPTTAWLTATLLSDGVTIKLVADRSQLSTLGNYQARVDVTSNGGNGNFLVDVTLAAGSAAKVTDVGTVLIDLHAYDVVTGLETAASARTVRVVASNGYTFAIGGLAAGFYDVYCGVDTNADGVLQPGERTGAYPTLSAVAPLDLTKLKSLRLDLALN